MIQRLESYQVNTKNIWIKTSTPIFLSFEYLLIYFSFWRTSIVILYLQATIWFTWNNWIQIKNNKLPFTQVQLPNYNFESTPTESIKGGTIIYIKKNTNYKLRKDLTIYKPNQLEPTFIKVIQNKEAFIVGCI